MKTREFINKVNMLGYEVLKTPLTIRVHQEPYGLKAHVYILNSCISLFTDDIDLAKLCIEYAETPINERVDEKKYIVIIPDPESEGSRFALARTVNGKIVINKAGAENIQRLTRYHLTESEIKKNHAYLWQFAKEI